MSNIAIKVEHLSKEYQIGHAKSGDLRESFGNKLGALLNSKQNTEIFTALNDVSFEVKKGEALGIIGRNGAGKSTLLKILSRITEPTKGKFEINGRVSSLLEVGTGFHPELSGRENIFLNGTILGMKRAEIKAKLDEIVAFSGVDKFIDTPVKHYSSGMKVRLAFSVAAHLEPEILIIDEVLAVGDAEFQKKCLGKMDDVSKNEGRTVIFVSHNMSAIKQLCNSAIYLQKGNIDTSGNIDNVINKYLFEHQSMQKKYLNTLTKRSNFFIKEVQILTSNEGNIHEFGKELKIILLLNFPFSIVGASLAYQICDSLGTPIVHQWVFDNRQEFSQNQGERKVTNVIPHPKLYMGQYSLNVFFADENKNIIEKLTNICPFTINMKDQRSQFSWKEGTCKYIEETNWKINEVL